MIVRTSDVGMLRQPRPAPRPRMGSASFTTCTRQSADNLGGLGDQLIDLAHLLPDPSQGLMNGQAANVVRQPLNGGTFDTTGHVVHLSESLVGGAQETPGYQNAPTAASGAGSLAQSTMGSSADGSGGIVDRSDRRVPAEAVFAS